MALAAVVAAAGIGFFAFGGGSGPAATPTPNTTPAGTATPTDGPTPTPDGSTDGPTATDSPSPTATLTPIENRTQRYSFDGRELNRTHYFRLAAVGNYTSRSNLTVDGEGYTRHVNISYVMDLQDAREYSVQVFTYEYDDGEDELFPVVSTYTAEETTWQRRQERTGGRNATVEKDTEPYEGEVEPVNTTLALDIGSIATGVIDRSAWRFVGNQTRNGVTLYRLEASGRHLGAAVPGNVTEGSATFVIGDDGIVRYVTYEFVAVDDGERTRYAYESFYGRLGSTNVPRPDWAD